MLDNLRKLFKRLPDGHYRIYQIQPDGVERLVVDVIVRAGPQHRRGRRSRTTAGDMPPQAATQRAAPADELAAPQDCDERSGQDDTDVATLRDLARSRCWPWAAGTVATRRQPQGRCTIATSARRDKSRRLTKVPRLLGRLR